MNSVDYNLGRSLNYSYEDYLADNNDLQTGFPTNKDNLTDTDYQQGNEFTNYNGGDDYAIDTSDDNDSPDEDDEFDNGYDDEADDSYDDDADDSYDDEDDYDDEDEYDFDDETIYEVKCVCGEVIDFDEETLEAGSIVCDECGETLEFTFDDEDEDEE